MDRITVLKDLITEYIFLTSSWAQHSVIHSVFCAWNSVFKCIGADSDENLDALGEQA